MTESSDNTGTNDRLQGAFGDRGTNVNAISYGHPHGEKIIAEAREVLSLSETGRLLLRASQKGNIPVNVIKGTGDSGFSVESRIVFIQTSGKAKKADPKTILYYAKALREADQDLMGYKAPDPDKDIMEYATALHAKNMDAITYVCKIVKELTDTEYFTILLDVLDEIGYKRVYEVYARDGSQEEIFKAYAEQ
jgi:hypothetical protein